jgi:hypothetical protein
VGSCNRVITSLFGYTQLDSEHVPASMALATLALHWFISFKQLVAPGAGKHPINCRLGNSNFARRQVANNENMFATATLAFGSNQTWVANQFMLTTGAGNAKCNICSIVWRRCNRGCSGLRSGNVQNF